jgi:hypothetical protein
MGTHTYIKAFFDNCTPDLLFYVLQIHGARSEVNRISMCTQEFVTDLLKASLSDRPLGAF